MTQERKNTNGHDILRGGRAVMVEHNDGTTEQVFVREVTVKEILDGHYVELLRTDPMRMLEWLMDKPEGWSEQLTRDSWTALREAEEAVNFMFALAETKAAHERGQRLKFIDEAIMEQSENLLKIMGSVTSSASTAGSRGPAKKRPAESPSAG